MIAADFPEANVDLAMGQDQYEPLRVCHWGTHNDKPDPNGFVTASFRLSDAEIDEIVRTRTLWYTAMTFNRGFQPLMMTTLKPDFKLE